MKYLVALVIVVLLVRIDWILHQYDILSERWSTPATPVIQDSEIKSNRETIPVTQDASFKQTPRQVFLALLEDFHNAPEKEVRVRAMEYFKTHPTLFTQKLDPDLESTIFKWRDLLNNNEPEVANFLIDLLNIFQGENQLMVRRFFALWMDINMEHFLAAYSRTKDTNCMIATTFGDNIPEEEKVNELREREEILKGIVAKEDLEPVRKALATNCLLVLSLEIQKYPPLPAAETEAPAIDPNASESQP